jgi:amino-acid N-acetyltransferase
MTLSITPATDDDVEGILKIVNVYAAENLMLYRTKEQIQAALPGFLVAKENEQVIGCGSLVELTPELTEVRSLAVSPEQRGNGLGARIVDALIERARAAGYPQVCALTLREDFFNRLGFQTVDRWTVSPKIWLECIYCSKYNACDEIAVLMNLQEAEVVRPANPQALQQQGLPFWRRSLAWLASDPAAATKG